VQNVYSPTHPITVSRVSDRHARVHFEGRGVALDKDFQLYYTTANKDVGLTALMHHAERGADGYFMLLISPRAELARTQQVPRDMVFVLDTSGSMQGRRIEQARNALKYCLKNLGAKDRFALIQFATTVNRYNDSLLPASARHIVKAQTWVDSLEATGSTNINDALLAALAMRPADPGRCFTVVFFTDGQPTISETNPGQIVRNVMAKNTASTRIFTFGVGDDVNAVLLDQLADKTRSVSTYVRETEDIEAKVCGLYAKISHPVLTDLKLAVGEGVTISEVYPPQLPDLFHGSQLVVLGRYRGHGHAAVRLSGTVGRDSKDFVYEVKFPSKTNGDKAFVEDLWARRKVGYLLDQIRTGGTNKELVDEVVRLAKKYGITTPYTSYLVAPDQQMRVINQDMLMSPAAQGPAATNGTANAVTHQLNAFRGMTDRDGSISAALGMPGGQGNVIGSSSAPTSQPVHFYVGVFKDSPAVNGSQAMPTAPTSNGRFAATYVSPSMQWSVPAPAVAGAAPAPPTGSNYYEANGISPAVRRPRSQEDYFIRSMSDAEKAAANDEEEEEEEKKEQTAANPVFDTHSGKFAVDLSLRLSELRNQSQVGREKMRPAAGRNCVNVRGVWVDDRFDPKLPVVKLKAQGAAYFRILERQPQMSEVFRLGNRVIWVTPSRTVLVIDPTGGKDSMTDDEIDALFVAKQ
jgi:Ca-activated chloride channel family protein